MTENKPKEKFNQKAPAKQAEAAVTAYTDAPAAGKNAMKKLMEAIDRNPDSFEAVISYGAPPIAVLSQVMQDMLRISGDSGAYFKTLTSAAATATDALGVIDVEKFAEETLKKIRAQSSGTPDTSDKKFLKEVQDTLPKMQAFARAVIAADATLTDFLKKVADTEAARAGAGGDIGVYLGASTEVLRRYDEEYIPEAKKQFAGSGDPEDELYLKDVTKRREDFTDRITVLKGCRTASAIAGQQLREMVETIEDMRGRIRETASSNKNAWQAMLAAAGVSTPGVNADPGLDFEKEACINAKRKPEAPKPK